LYRASGVQPAASAVQKSDAAKLNTPVQSRVVEACSELRQCAPRRSSAERQVSAVRWVAVPKHVMVLK
jgi:hypothetical protein